MFNLKENLNIEIDCEIIENVAEKIGSLFGKKGRQIGKIIDSLTKDVTIKICNGDNDERDDSE